MLRRRGGMSFFFFFLKKKGKKKTTTTKKKKKKNKKKYLAPSPDGFEMCGRLPPSRPPPAPRAATPGVHLLDRPRAWSPGPEAHCLPGLKKGVSECEQTMSENLRRRFETHLSASSITFCVILSISFCEEKKSNKKTGIYLFMGSPRLQGRGRPIEWQTSRRGPSSWTARRRSP